SPPTPRSHGPRLRSPLPSVYLERVRLFFARRSVRTPTHDASGTDHRLPVVPDFFEGKRGSPRLLGHPRYTRREPNTTPDVRRSYHDDRRNCCLQGLWNLGHPEHVLFSGPPRRGSCTCMPSHRRCRRRSPSPGLLPSDPARSSRAEFASAGRQTEISEALSHAPPSQTNVAWSLP